jgi:hypothetical protein
LALLQKMQKALAAIPDDTSCFTCTHYDDGRCVMGNGVVVPEEIRLVGCEMRADSVGTVFG